MNQSLINIEKSGLGDALGGLADTPTDLESVILGVDDAKVWDKKLKVRVTSNKTGRKIDFNLTFKHISVKED